MKAQRAGALAWGGRRVGTMLTVDLCDRLDVVDRVVVIVLDVTRVVMVVFDPPPHAATASAIAPRAKAAVRLISCLTRGRG